MTKWHVIDQEAAKALLQTGSAPGRVFPIPTSALPGGLTQMPGVSAYYVSGYITTVPGLPVVIGGEMAVVRADGDVAKGYNYVFGTSSDEKVVLAGPYKNFPEHHSPTSQPIEVAALFGHTSYSPKSK